MNGLENISKELAKDYSDIDCKEYKFQEEQRQAIVAQKEEDFTINKWRSLKSLNPQGMDLNVWLSIHFERGFDATENMQRNDIRVLESKERHIEDSGNGAMKMVSCILMKLQRCSGWTRRSCQLLNTGVMTKRQDVSSRKNGILGWKSQQRQSILAAIAEYLQCSGIGTRTKGKVAKAQ